MLCRRGEGDGSGQVRLSQVSTFIRGEVGCRWDGVKTSPCKLKHLSPHPSFLWHTYTHTLCTYNFHSHMYHRCTFTSQKWTQADRPIEGGRRGRMGRRLRLILASHSGESWERGRIIFTANQRAPSHVLSQSKHPHRSQTYIKLIFTRTILTWVNSEHNQEKKKKNSGQLINFYKMFNDSILVWVSNRSAGILSKERLVIVSVERRTKRSR